MLMVKKRQNSLFFDVRRALQLAIPLIAAQLVQALSPFFATMMIAHLGDKPFAASALVNAVYLLFIVFMFGLFGAVGVLVSQAFGAKDHKGVQAIAKGGFVLAFWVSLPMMLGLWFSPHLLLALGQDSSIVLLSTPYLHALIWTIFPLALIVVIEQFLIGLLKSRLVLWVSLLEVPCEIFFIYVLVFGKWGFPKLGMAGAGYAFVIVYLLTVIFFLLCILLLVDTRKYAIFSKIGRYSYQTIREIIVVGSPIGLMYLIEVSLFSLVAVFMGLLGDEKLAAYQIVWQYFGLAITAIFAISQATTVSVGYAVGQKDRDSITRSLGINIAIALILMLGVAIVFIGFPLSIIRWDVDPALMVNYAIVRYALLFFILASSYLLIDSIRLMIIAALRGMKDTAFSMWVSFLTFWVLGFPLSYLFAFYLHWDGAGLWFALIVAIVTAGLILSYRFSTIMRLKIR